MTFLHSGLLLGLLLTAVPIVLHLLLRQKPKRVDFPALRLVQSRNKRSTKRLRLRHVALLALRVLLIAGMVFAAARPLLPAADWSLRWWDGLLLVGLVGGAVAAQRWWNGRVASAPGQATKEQLDKRGRWGIWGGMSLLMGLLVLLPYGNRVRASMSEAPSAEALDLPVAGVVVFDVSASMTYREGGKTLLDVGRQIVADHVGALPSGSRIAVTSNASDQAVLFQVSLSSVPTQLERLTFSANARRLNGVIRAALDAQEADRERLRSEGGDRDRFVRRVYVVTDLAKSAWQFPDSSGLAERLADDEATGLFVLDVGKLNATNRGFEELTLSSEELTRGNALTVRTRFRTTGTKADDGETLSKDVSAEMYLADGGEPARVAAQPASSDGQSLTFVPTMSGDSNVIDGTVRLGATDPLEIDDVRYFTVGVTPLPRLLLVAESFEDLDELSFSLTGDETLSVPSRYAVTKIRPNGLTATALQRQDVVCLVNVPRLEDRQWSAVEAFVRAGGGLAVFLGSESVESFSYNRASAQSVLPAKLDVYGSRPADDEARLVFSNQQGPFVDRIAVYEDALPIIESARVRRFWRVQPAEDSRVIARYTADALPALMERRVDQGTAVMLTTAIDIKPAREAWNNLMLLDNGAYWASILFCDQLMRHLARVGESRRNFTAGEVPIVELPPELPPQKLRLQTPDLRSLPLDFPAESTLSVPEVTEPGHYRVTGEDGNTLAAFSVNYRAEESDLTRASDGDLASVFGEEQFQVARGLDELNEDIDIARFGQEAFPLLVLLAVAFFAGETLLSSRFYET